MRNYITVSLYSWLAREKNAITLNFSVPPGFIGSTQRLQGYLTHRVYMKIPHTKIPPKCTYKQITE